MSGLRLPPPSADTAEEPWKETEKMLNADPDKLQQIYCLSDIWKNRLFCLHVGVPRETFEHEWDYFSIEMMIDRVDLVAESEKVAIMTHLVNRFTTTCSWKRFSSCQQRTKRSTCACRNWGKSIAFTDCALKYVSYSPERVQFASTHCVQKMYYHPSISTQTF